MQKRLILIGVLASVGASGLTLARQQFFQAGPQKADGEITQAPCIYKGQSFPEGTVIEGRVCRNGVWQ